MAEQQNQNKNANAKEQDIHQLLKVRREKLSELQTEGRDPFQITKYDQTAHSADIKDHYAEYDGKEVSIAGRIMSKRVMGKASFCNVQDLKGNIQCYVCRDDLGEDSYKDFKRMDIGDIVGIKGFVFTTKMDMPIRKPVSGKGVKTQSSSCASIPKCARKSTIWCACIMDWSRIRLPRRQQKRQMQPKHLSRKQNFKIITQKLQSKN